MVAVEMVCWMLDQPEVKSDVALLKREQTDVKGWAWLAQALSSVGKFMANHRWRLEVTTGYTRTEKPTEVFLCWIWGLVPGAWEHLWD